MAVPAIITLSVWTTHLHGMVWTVENIGGQNITFDNSWGIGLVLSYVYIWGAAGLFIVSEVEIGADQTHHTRSLLIFLGAGTPLLATIATLLTETATQGTVSTSIFIGGLIMARASSSHEPLELAPEIRTTTSSIFDDAVLIFDKDEGFVEGSSDAECIFSNDTLKPGASAADILGGSLEEMDGKTINTEKSKGVYTIRHSELTDYKERVIGYIAVLREVTELRKHEQRLEVSNRILRHNVRNKLNIILGISQTAKQKNNINGGLEEDFDSIYRSAKSLHSLAEQARYLEGSLSWDQNTTTETDLGSIVAQTASEYDDKSPEAELTVNLPETPIQIATPGEDVLETVIANLVENAIEHNKEGDTTVNIDVQNNGMTAKLIVSDNGPGIPKEEIRPLQKGETQLNHGSGIGLWIVYWFVKSMGGKIVLSTDENGTEVIVRLPKNSAELDIEGKNLIYSSQAAD